MTDRDLVELARTILPARQYEAWKISETLPTRDGKPAGYLRVSMVMGCSPENARALLRKARTKLANHLDEAA